MWRKNVEEWNLLMNSLVDLKVTADQKRVFVDSWGPTRLPKVGLDVSDRVMNNIEAARGQFNSIMAGVTTEGVNDSAYGLVQAAIEFQQHFRGVRGADEVARAESKFKRAYLDRDSLTIAFVASTD